MMSPQEFQASQLLRGMVMPPSPDNETRQSMSTQELQANVHMRVGIESAIRDAIEFRTCRQTGACALCIAGVSCEEVIAIVGTLQETAEQAV